MSNELKFIETKEAIEILLEELGNTCIGYRRFINFNPHDGCNYEEHYIKIDTCILKIIPDESTGDGEQDDYIKVYICNYKLEHVGKMLSARLFPEDICELGRFLKFILG